MVRAQRIISRWLAPSLWLVAVLSSPLVLGDEQSTVRVFIFAGQSNMVGSDSKVRDIERFPRYVGLEQPQPNVLFSYSIGRDNNFNSSGWTSLKPINNVVGPELSFARFVTKTVDAPIAIIKCAAGGTHLGGDWNPDDPQGFKMYPRALQLVRASLAELESQGRAYRIEGFMWHQGENDMFNAEYMANYGKNLANYLARWRRDLKAPTLKFYIGELCTKTIWGMDLRPRMYAISQGQKAVTAADPLAEYVPTAHVGVEIGGGVGLHYHYGTLGQLQHGENYAVAYLRTLGEHPVKHRRLAKWPYQKGSSIKLFVLAGHRNMEGERAFVQHQQAVDASLLKDNEQIAYRYSLGGGYKESADWEPLGLVDYYDTFGPELSFARTLSSRASGNIAIAKFTHSGSQLNDWTPDGTPAKDRHIYPRFIAFVKDSIEQLESRGHRVELAGVFYHMGENEMSMPPYRKSAPAWLQALVAQSRQDLGRPKLHWIVSQQPPTDDKRVNAIDVTRELERVAAADPALIHLKAFTLPPQEKKLVLNTAGIVRLGELLAETYLAAGRVAD